VRGPAARCGLMSLRVPQKTSTMVFGRAASEDCRPGAAGHAYI